MWSEIVTTGPGAGDRTRVGAFADVVILGACRCDFDHESGPGEPRPRDGFDHRRAADVAHAEEKNAHAARILGYALLTQRDARLASARRRLDPLDQAQRIVRTRGEV